MNWPSGDGYCFFVREGPSIIQNNTFIATEVPAGAIKPIEVTVGANQVGLYKETAGMKPPAPFIKVSS